MADDISLIVGVDYSELTGLVKTTAQTKAALGSIAKEFANSGSQKAYMAGINKLVVAQNKLDKSARMSRSEIMKLGAQMKQEAQFANALTRATTGLGGSLQQAGRRTNQLGVLMQQTGYQVGDFAVQVQSGTNVMVALGQQATQLVGTFGMLAKSTKMIGLFAGLGIAIPIITGIAAAFMRMRDSAEEVEEEILKLSDSISKLNSIQKTTAADFEKGLNAAFGSSATAVGKLLSSLREARFVSAMEPVLSTLDDITAGVDRVDIALKTIDGFNKMAEDGQALSSVQKALLKDSEDLVFENLALASAYEDVRGSLDKIGQSKTSSDLVKNFAEALEKAEALGGPVGQDLAAALRTAADEAGILEEITNSAADAAARFADNLVLGQGFLVNSVKAGVKSGAIPPEALNDLPQTDAEKAMERILENRRREARREKSTSSSGGSNTSDTNENYLDNLLRETKLKAQLVGVSEQEAAKLKLLNTLEAKGIDLNDDRVKTLIEEQKNLAELEKAYEAQQDMVGMFKDTLTDALMSVIDGSRSVADAFKNMMRQILSSLAQKSIIQPLVSGLTGGIAGGAAGGLMGGLAAGAGIAATMGTIGSAIGTGFMASAGGFISGGLAGGAGAIGAQLSATAAGGFGAASIAASIGAVAAPLLAVAAVFSFFKKKVKELDSGISATVTNMDSYVESFSTIQTKRFWGLSKKVSTNTTAMDADNPISAAIASVQQSIFSTAQYLGIATDSLSAFSYEFKLSLKGLSEEAKMQKIAEEVNKLGDAFANLLPNVLNMEHLTAIMDERYSLETRLLEAQGNTEALRERELANTNEYNRAILEQIFAAEDAKAALDNLNNSLKETDFATLLDFNRAKAYARLGMNVANSPEVPSMSNTAASGVQAITNPMNTASGEIVQLRSEMKEMHKEAMFAYSKLIKNGKDSRDTLRSWDVVGLPAERTA